MVLGIGLDGANLVAVEYLGKLLERHSDGGSENDIRTAWRDFVVRTGIVGDEREISTEVPPGDGSVRRVDLRVRNTYVEFKKQIFVNGAVDGKYVEQLDGYLLKALQSGWGIRNGILTDGKNYLKRDIGEHILPLVKNAPRVWQYAAQGPNLREYLHDIIAAEGEGIAPSAETLTKHLGIGSDLFRQAAALLTDAHNRHRDNSTVAVKRKLWRELLEVALGQDSAGDAESADYLFIRHTYLTTVVSLILQAHFGIDVAEEAYKNPGGLLNGDALYVKTGLKGVIESDLFQWPGEVGEWEYVRVIAGMAMRFDWSGRAEELAATLYQNTILPEERRKMGEYYTPKWLARAIVDEVVGDPLGTVVMDPACGSGTFIECMAQRLIGAAEVAGLGAGETLERLLGKIVGIDLHPVAVQLAKATWVLSCREVITAARAAGHRDDITPPVRLGDSLQLRYDRRTIFSGEYIVLATNEFLDGERLVFQVPMSLARRADVFGRLLMELAQAVQRGQDGGRVLDIYGAAEGAERDGMSRIAEQMGRLHRENRDHVWAYYLRNMVRPAVIAEDKAGAIVGNPPWQTYSRSADIVREELENLCKDTYGIWAGGRQAPHQDVSAMFFARVADLYLEDGGVIGMVLPHSALRTGQHWKWRGGYWQSQQKNNRTAISVNFRVKTPWDLDQLEPNTFFPMPCSVVFAERAGKYSDLAQGRKDARGLAPGLVEVWRGPTGTDLVARDVEPLHHDDGEFHSPYAGLSMQGPSIVDRRLFFVTAKPNEGLLAVPDTYVTSPRIGGQDKKQYDVSALDGNIVHDDNLFDVYLGECIAPYVALTPAKAVLPVSKATMVMPLDHSDCPEDAKTGKVKHIACRVDTLELDARMQYRWPVMESLWDANKGKNDDKSLIQRLNFNRSLTTQLRWMRRMMSNLDETQDILPVRIAYAAAGRPTAALIENNQAIIDYKCFQVSCKNLSEAYYLLAIINSITLETSAIPFRPKGLFGERDLQKHLWKLPIPGFDGANGLHVRLSELGMAAAGEAREWLGELGAGRERAALRGGWQRESPTARGIEVGVGELLGG